MLAHHADDQAETILYRLLRGAGPKGLAGMPVQRHLGKGVLFRPLLAARRSSITDWAKRRQLEFVDDPSNDDQSIDRNYLRHAVVPILQARWPGCIDTITRAGELQARTIDELLQLPLPIVTDSLR